MPEGWTAETTLKFEADSDFEDDEGAANGDTQNGNGGDGDGWGAEDSKPEDSKPEEPEVKEEEEEASGW